MFRFTYEPSSGSYNQFLAKIRSLVHLMSVRTDEHTHSRSQHVAITLTASVPTRTVEQDL